MNLFLHPWFLTLLLPAGWLAFRVWRRDQPAILNYSSAAVGLRIKPTPRQRVSWLPTLLMLVSLVLMIVAMARPRDGKERTSIDSAGIAIQMVVDRSSSMRALDFEIDGQPVNRLTAVKDVATKFVLGDRFVLDKQTDRGLNLLPGDADQPGQAGSLGGRPTDRIGLIRFAGYADAVTPPTLDHRYLTEQLDRIRIADGQAEGGTAIGDALSLAAERLDSLAAGGQTPIKSKVVILLTDGENTAGQVEPEQAAALAKTLGVKVYAIGVGTDGQAPIPVQRRPDGRVLVQMIDVSIDEATLKMIADTTGGRSFRATDTRSLEKIYAEIDLLERTKFKVDRYVDYRELAVKSIGTSLGQFPPLLLVAFLALAAAVLLSQTLFRTLT